MPSLRHYCVFIERKRKPCTHDTRSAQQQEKNIIRAPFATTFLETWLIVEYDILCTMHAVGQQDKNASIRCRPQRFSVSAEQLYEHGPPVYTTLRIYGM